MKTYKVKALYCSGAGKKMYRSGDIVPESAWPRGRAAELARRGFLEEVYSDVEPTTNTTEPAASIQRIEIPAPPPVVVDAAPVVETTTPTDAPAPMVALPEPATPVVQAKKEYKDTTIGELKEYLTTHNIPFDEKDGKKVWYKLYLAHQ